MLPLRGPGTGPLLTRAGAIILTVALLCCIPRMYERWTYEVRLAMEKGRWR